VSIAAEVVRDRYQDSVRLMRIGEALRREAGVQAAGVVMGTPANQQLLKDADLWAYDVATATPGDIVIAVRAGSELEAAAALAVGVRMLDEQRGHADRSTFTSTRAAIEAADETALGFVAVPGEHAAVEAESFLDAGHSVFVFSDNVSIEDERRLKQRAHELGLFVMGPDAGTALVGGIGIGFCNDVPSGEVGIIAASGTGAQAVASHLARLGVGVSVIVGLGGRDTSDAIGGSTMMDALTALENDPDTRVMVLIAKTMGFDVGRRLMSALGTLSKPIVLLVPGWRSAGAMTAFGAAPAHSFSDAARRAAELLVALDREPRSSSGSVPPTAIARTGGICGLFAGGTLALEAESTLKELNATESDRVIEIVDLGDDVFTAGRPHPMIAPSLQAEQIIAASLRSDISVLMFDVVLGYGSHSDPGAVLAPAVRQALSRTTDEGPELRVVAVICGTDTDLQGIDETVDKLREAGAIVVDDVSVAAAYALGLLPPTPITTRSIRTPRLPRPRAVITVGTDWFDEGLTTQGAVVTHVEWRPVAGGDQELQAILGRLG